MERNGNRDWNGSGKRWRIGLAATALVVSVATGGLLSTGRPGLAQDGTPEAVVDPVDVGHPAFVYTGSCGALGDTAATLSELTVTQGDIVGTTDAIAVSRSFTTVPLSLEALLAADYALNVHLSAQAIDTSLACGDIGGVLDVNGALTVGLQEVDDSGRTGIAYLAPGDDPATTGILIFMTESDVTVGAQGGLATPVAGPGTPGAAARPIAPTPSPTPSLEETVEVALTEWAITMPTTLEAGPVIFRIVNDGTVPHTFQITGETVFAALPASIGPGETADLEVDLPPGTYDVICTLGDGVHRDMGMQTTVTVE